MNIPATVPISPEVQHARTLLAELCERCTRTNRDAHLNILLAFDALEGASSGLWPPPSSAVGIASPEVALLEVRTALEQILADVATHYVHALPVALARDFVALALEHLR